MEVKMNKEIQDYKESFFFGLSMRQCFFSLLAVAAATGVYLGLKDLLGTEITGWMSVLAVAPLAAFRFFTLHQMILEKFSWGGGKFGILYSKELVFRSENLYVQCLDEMRQAGIRSCENGAEVIEKKRSKKNRRQKQTVKKSKGRGDAVD